MVPISFPKDVGDDSPEELTDGEHDMAIASIGDSTKLKLEPIPNKNIRVAVWIFNDDNPEGTQLCYLGDWKEWQRTTPVFYKPDEGETPRKCVIRGMNNNISWI